MFNIADLKDILEGAELSDDTALKLKVMVENAINEKVEAVKAECAQEIEALVEKADAYSEFVVNEMTEKANAYADYVINEMSEKVDSYATYVVEQFVEQNQAQFVESAEFTRVSNALNNIKRVFEENYYVLTDNPDVSSFEKLAEEAKTSYNNLFNEHTGLKKKFDELLRISIFENATRGLADTQRDKVADLVENVKFDGIKEFERGVTLMVEEISKKSKSGSESSMIKEEVVHTSIPHDTKETSDKMSVYLSRL